MESIEKKKDKEGKKRLIGTLDPDYISPPDSKKIKLLQAKGEEEFYGRVVKVVEEQFLEAINEKNLEIEEIDEKILKVQQCLHTLRYCVSLNFYAFGKLKGKIVSDDKNPQVNHPTIRHHLGKPSSSLESLPVSESLSAKYQKTKEEPKDSSSSISTENKTEPESKNVLHKNLDKPSSSIQHIPPQHKCEVISQGRQGRFQRKVRVVIGNTYQYIPDSEGIDDHLKFKWRTYVRGPPENNDVSNFISSVKFTLDKSYSPHDIITIREPPFSLSRRGWGEFKIYLELMFADPRNKPIQLLHHLTLARTDDPLAFTGIWRLGKEMWYDIWLYDKMEESETCVESVESEPVENKQTIPSALEEGGLKSKTVYRDNEGNMTLAHSFDKEVVPVAKEEASDSSSSELIGTVTVENGSKKTENCSNVESKGELNDKVSKKIVSVNGTPQKPSNAANLNATQNSNTDLPQFTKEAEKGDQKLHKILIRQTDGTLVSWMVPKSMYNMALKFSEKNLSKSNSQSGSVKTNVSKASEITPNGTAKKIVVAPNSVNGSILSQTSFPLDTKNGFLKSVNIPQNNVRRPLVRTRGQAITVPRIPLVQTAEGTLVRVNSLQKPVLPNPQFTSQPVSQVGVQSRPTLIKVPESVIKTNANNQSLGKSTFKTSTTAVGSNSIRLSVSTVSANSTKVIKTAFLNDKNILNLKTPVSIKSPLVTTAEGIRTPQKVTVNSSLLNNTIKVNTSKILCSVPSNNVSLVGTNVATNTLKTSLQTPSAIPFQENVSTALASGGDTSPSGKITTRRIFISAPPHLVKLREAAVQKAEVLNPKKEEIPKAKAKVGVKKLAEEAESEISPLEKYEERKKLLRSQSERCASVDEILRIYMKGLPLFLTEETKDLDLSFCAPSYDHFKCCLVGRRRAVEFWRAREIRKELKLLKVPNWQDWNTVKIASWARRHGYTPVNTLSVLNALEKLRNSQKAVGTCSLGTLSEIEVNSSMTKSVHKTEADHDHSLIVIDSDEEDDDKNLEEKAVKESVFEVKRKENPILIVTPHTAEESNFIDLSLSKVRLKMEPEEVVPGVKMDVAKNVIWKATMCFMEDVLRSAYAEATSSYNPFGTMGDAEDREDEHHSINVEANHLLLALLNGRPQFQLFSQFGLGKEAPKDRVFNSTLKTTNPK